MKFTVKKTANIVSIINEDGIVFKTWYIENFSDRKLATAMKKIQKTLPEGKAEFTKTF